MDELSQDDKNKFVDSNGKGWLVLTGSSGSQPFLTRDYLINNFMRKVGRGSELMRRHLEMKGYPHMADRRKYDEVMRMRGGTSAGGRRQAESDSMMPEEREENSGSNYVVDDDLANRWRRPGQH